MILAVILRGYVAEFYSLGKSPALALAAIVP
jgi:hypothetical protein